MSDQGPAIDYLAKDYQSFRQLMLDRLAATLPAWAERHPPDLGIAIVEALAYVGDYLSYYQDAVATEAYLGTARRRISVRRHARLLDYVLHEGCNARAWVQICVNSPLTLDPCVLEFLAIGTKIGSSPAMSADELRAAPHERYIKFLPVYDCPIELRQSWNCVKLNGQLKQGATRATFSSPGDLFKPGSVLILRAQPKKTAKSKDVPAKYHAVSLIGVEEDEHGERSIIWHEDDALPDYMARISDVHALGNIVLVDHGHWDSPPETALRVSDGRLGPLAKTRLTHRQPVQVPPPNSAAKAIVQDPRAALPHVVLTETRARSPIVWGLRRDLLESCRTDRHFCEEVDDNGNVWLRFGDGDGVGARPEDDSDNRKPQFSVTYRVGNGESGNVPAEAITQLVIKKQMDFNAFCRVWNPMPAVGGTEPESIARARVLAPANMRIPQHRAISPEDYAGFARQVPGIKNAAVRILQQGARRVVRVAVDPLGFDPDARDDKSASRWRALARHVRQRLDQVRRINHDVTIVAPGYVDVILRLKIGIFPSHVPGSVRAAVWRALGFDRDDASGEKGFFHPDNLTFGQSIHWSQIISVVHAIPGVAYVDQIEFRRADMPVATDPAPVVEIGPLEIAHRDEDHSVVEIGPLEITHRDEAHSGIDPERAP